MFLFHKFNIIYHIINMALLGLLLGFVGVHFEIEYLSPFLPGPLPCHPFWFAPAGCNSREREANSRDREANGNGPGLRSNKQKHRAYGSYVTDYGALLIYKNE